jgi:hypothetical protein
MFIIKRFFSATAIAFWSALSFAAPTADPVRAEIDTLLSRLQVSGCQFNRNGSWFSGAEAKDHLLSKLDYIEGRSTIQSTEQFIELAASKSSFSGKPYQVKCGSEAPINSQSWLTRQLAAIRSFASKAKP